MAEQRTQLGKRIAEARVEKRWKQKQLAAAVHVEPMTVSRWERGQHAPDIDMLEMIARATDKPLSFFVDATPIPEGAFERLEAEVAEVRQAQARMETMLAEALGKRGPRAVPSAG